MCVIKKRQNYYKGYSTIPTLYSLISRLHAYVPEDEYISNLALGLVCPIATSAPPVLIQV